MKLGKKSVSVSNKNKKALMFFSLAIICGIIAAGIVYVAGTQATPRVLVLEVTTEVKKGNPLNPSMFREVQKPPAGIAEGTLRPNTPLDGSYAARDLYPGAVLRASDVVRVDTGGIMNLPLLSTRLKSLNKDELRAVEVPTESLAGMLAGMSAGDKVDIISVNEITNEDNEKTLQAETIIYSAQVIGVQAPGEGPGTLIVAITNYQAVEYALAREKGKIMASLIPFGVDGAPPEDEQKEEQEQEEVD